MIRQQIFGLMFGFLVCFTHQSLPKAVAQELPENLRTENLVAWCIVPFDAEKRGPEERATMLQELGLKKLAYDWREEHVPTWGDELKALNDADVELTAFWCSSSLQPSKHPGNVRIFEFLKKNKVQTQLWFMLPTGTLDRIEDPKERLAAASKAVRDLAEAGAELGCSVGIYNHGGWPGKPSTLVAIMKDLLDLDNVGLVYNFHHAHEDLAE
ncbi:MAG: pyrrolo-quinoline quinone, partial [Planctomycetota bacterium]